MSARTVRALVVVAIPALAALALAVGTSPWAAAAGSGSADHAFLIKCEKAILFAPDPSSALPVPGSGAATAAQFAVFRRPRSAADVLPAGVRIASALRFAHVASYDPTRLVRLRRQGSGGLYALPATIGPVTLPPGCGVLPQLKGLPAYLAAQQDQRGAGPGACLFAVSREPVGIPGPYLPGARNPTVTTRPRASFATCESDTILTGYTGALGTAFGSGLALVPDGVDAIAYTLASGRRLTMSVTGNLVTTPAALVIAPSPHRLTAAALTSELVAHLPTTIAETGPSGQLVATLSRPDTLIPDLVGEVTFLSDLVASSSRSGAGSAGSESSSSSSVGAGAWCQTRTHRCVAVLVNSSCDRHQRCRITRAIYRYRYVGRKPPLGSTGVDTQPTAPIVGRIDRLVSRPRTLSLAISGALHRPVVVLTAVECFARNRAAGGSSPPLHVEVPSRTRIPLPGRAGSFTACAVGALVTSAQRGAVRVRIVRG